MRSFSLTAALAAMYGNFAGAVFTCETAETKPPIVTIRQCGIDELDDPITGAFALSNTQF